MKQVGYAVTADGAVFGTIGIPFWYAQESAERYRTREEFKGKVLAIVPVFIGEPVSVRATHPAPERTSA